MEDAKKRMKQRNFKKTSGYKIFGDEWEFTYNLCDELLQYRSYEQILLRRIMIIGHKLSLPLGEEKEAYTLILYDLKRKYDEQVKVVQTLEVEVAESFETLCRKMNVLL